MCDTFLFELLNLANSAHNCHTKEPSNEVSWPWVVFICVHVAFRLKGFMIGTCYTLIGCML